MATTACGLLRRLAPSQLASVEVTASAPGLLDAWVDFDGDGLVDAGEQVFVSVLLNAGGTRCNSACRRRLKSVTLYLRGSASAVWVDWDSADLPPNGEVEDYALTSPTGSEGTSTPAMSSTRRIMSLAKITRHQVAIFHWRRWRWRRDRRPRRLRRLASEFRQLAAAGRRSGRSVKRRSSRSESRCAGGA